MRFFTGIKHSIAKFMYGRYGLDELYKTSFIIYFVLVVINTFTRDIFTAILCYIVLAIMFYRAFSKQLDKRRAENAKYLAAKKSVKGFFSLQKNRFRDRKTHIYRHCSYCHAVIRLPKKKGKHTVKCPACGKSFGVNVLL